MLLPSLLTHMKLREDFSFAVGSATVTFTRADAGANTGDTSFIDNTGKVNFVAANVARFTGSALVFEGTSTNDIEESIDFADAYWFKSSITIIGDQNQPDPSGSNTASRLRSDNTAGQLHILSNPVTAVEGDEITASWFIAEGTSDRLTLTITNLNTFATDGRVDITWVSGVPVTSGVIGSVKIKSGLVNGFFRVELTTTLVGAATIGYSPSAFPVGLSIGGTANEDTIFWGMQGETDRTQATTFIRSEGAATTRAIEDLELGASSTRVDSDDPVTYAITSNFTGAHFGIATVDATRVTMSEFSILETGYLRLNNLDVFQGGLTILNDDNSATFVKNVDTRMLVRGSTSIAVETFVDSVSDGPDTPVVASFAIVSINLGTTNVATSPMYGELSDFRVYSTALTNTEVTADFADLDQFQGLHTNSTDWIFAVTSASGVGGSVGDRWFTFLGDIALNGIDSYTGSRGDRMDKWLKERDYSGTTLNERWNTFERTELIKW